ncbi:Aldo/keto reductase [Saccharata proteae CBS 121410]|uniref:Aldo/keto reductase n=1 Tax=Saccharata proteae CBS 121410 TaxID=1314787 RepID=A0A9P4HP47_9PEZI|nr:Aldo/keto reductase [Saccharata proteae CBS 121410]
MGDASLPSSLQKSIDSTKVAYRNLGKSGLRVSVPIFGCMSFGHKDWQPWVVDDEEAVTKLLGAAYDRGLNTWDTANIYSNGVSEEMIGKAIKKLNIPRNKVVILSKCWGTVGEEPSVSHIRHPQMKTTKDYINQGGLSRTAIFNAVDASLKRLDTGYLDLLQIHRFDATVPIEETMEALHDLVKSGKVRYIGASSMWAYQFAMMQFCAEKHGWTKFVSMQNQYSLCYREEEREMNKFCLETGVGLIPWAPLYRGHLARPLSSQETARSEATKKIPVFKDMTGKDPEIIKRVEELAGKKGWKMSQVALAWVVQKGALPIVGFSSVDRIDEACGVTGKTLSEEEMKYLEEPYETKAIVGHM